MQGVRGSNPLSSTTKNPQLNRRVASGLSTPLPPPTRAWGTPGAWRPGPPPAIGDHRDHPRLHGSWGLQVQVEQVLAGGGDRGLADTPQVMGGRRGAGAAGECRCCHPGPGNTRSSGRSHPDRPLRCAGSTEIPPERWRSSASMNLLAQTRSRRGPGRPGIWILIRQQSHAMGTLFDLRGHRMADTCGHVRCSR
jgi:hypothetical protein